MRIYIEKRNSISIFRIAGDIDMDTSPDIKKTFSRSMVNKNKSKVVINLKEVAYIDSSGLATLVEILKTLRASESKLKLTNLSDKVKGLFEITKLDKLFDISADEENAVNSF